MACEQLSQSMLYVFASRNQHLTPWNVFLQHGEGSAHLSGLLQYDNIASQSTLHPNQHCTPINIAPQSTLHWGEGGGMSNQHCIWGEGEEG